MVAATVEVAHGLPNIAFTTTSPSTAIRITRIARIATSAAIPPIGPDLLAHHLAEALAVAARRGDQDREVLHRAAEHHADQDVERPGQVSELRRQDRPDQRAGAGDRREVVPEHDPAVGGDEVLAVGEPVRRGDARVVERERPGRQKRRVEAVGERVGCRAPPPGTTRSRGSRRAPSRSSRARRRPRRPRRSRVPAGAPSDDLLLGPGDAAPPAAGPLASRRLVARAVRAQHPARERDHRARRRRGSRAARSCCPAWAR